MAISYNGLWKLLIDKSMYKKDLTEKLGISSATIAKMGKGESVSLEVLQKICDYMDCDIGDIMSFEKTEKERKVVSYGKKGR
jgi:DNA-binding Xre family transcriptional regulator